MYDLRQKVAHFRQSYKSLFSYYFSLKGMWQEIDYFKNYRYKCSKDVEYHKEVEESRVLDVLAGLNSEYDGFRIQILGKDPFLSLSEVTYLSRKKKIVGMPC